MLIPRQADILEIARKEGRVDVDSLAARFDVTPQTIRKDLNELCDVKKLSRVHGGAVYPSNTANFAYLSRRNIAAEGKEHIANAAASIIPDGASLILNIGTTTEAVARALTRHRDLMVITNNLNVATILSEAPHVELVVSGGMVRKSDGGIVGAAAIDLIRQFKVDFAVIGTSAIDEEGALLDFDYREVRVAQAILSQARCRILVADRTKFERKAPVQIGHMRDLDLFITDQPPPEAIGDLCREADVEVIVASEEPLTDENAAPETAPALGENL
ncbi:DeoR family transcriptional regulator [Salaquimonas pukyongi]|uniref:DeoR family transcriptional regulator n=1 Tax=Salaquimonas pukyongi TaxID=2712698 RepID=UPI0012EBC573|nr:DeoR/GlpR family DNA-binding transcription regulator [Salaquimonas pukyongi]